GRVERTLTGLRQETGKRELAQSGGFAAEVLGHLARQIRLQCTDQIAGVEMIDGLIEPSNVDGLSESLAQFRHAGLRAIRIGTIIWDLRPGRDRVGPAPAR